MSDALARALQSRRGKSVDAFTTLRDPLPGEMSSIDPSKDILPGDSLHPDIEAKDGMRESPKPTVEIEIKPGGDEDDFEDDDVRDAITDGASQQDYEDMKDMRPRSLGERAKMMALRSQYSK
jgi:hypothetical protein